MWLDKLKEIKNKTNLSTKDISVKTGINEKTIARIFSGDTDNPFMTTLIPICATLNCSLDDIFVDTKVVVGTEKLAENFTAIMDAIVKAKPAAAKGQYIKSVTLAASMGPGVKVAYNM